MGPAWIELAAGARPEVLNDDRFEFEAASRIELWLDEFVFPRMEKPAKELLLFGGAQQAVGTTANTGRAAISGVGGASAKQVGVRKGAVRRGNPKTSSAQ